MEDNHAPTPVSLPAETPNMKKEIALAIGNSTIADSILNSFNKLATQGQLVFPKGYNLGNQLKLMYTSLSQNGAIAKATPISIGEALTEAVIQGLEVDKKQCYFICYDKKMQMFRSYYGDVAVAKRTGLVKDIRARVIYDGDTYEIDTNEFGEEIIINHKTTLENHDKDIKGAYAWADCTDGTRRYCIMTWKEIQANWSKSRNTSGSVQKDFPQEMAKRTVIRRLVKMIFNTAPTDLSVESAAVIGSYNRTTDEEYDNSRDYSKGGTVHEGVAHIITDDDGEVIDNDPVEEDVPADSKECDGDPRFAQEFALPGLQPARLQGIHQARFGAAQGRD